MRQKLIEAYLDFFNNYLTTEKYAEDNGLTLPEAKIFLALAQQVYDHPHPEA